MSDDIVRSLYKAASIEHAIDRAYKRYGVVLTEEDCENIAQKILNKDGATMVRKDKKNSAVWVVEYKGKQLVTVFERKGKKGKYVKTFLPINFAEREKKKCEHSET